MLCMCMLKFTRLVNLDLSLTPHAILSILLSTLTGSVVAFQGYKESVK